MSFGEGNLRTAVAELTQEKRELEARIDKLMALNGEMCAEINEKDARIHELESFVSDYGRVCGGLCVDCEYGNPKYPNESDEMCLLAVSVKAYEIEVANG